MTRDCRFSADGKPTLHCRDGTLGKTWGCLLVVFTWFSRFVCSFTIKTCFFFFFRGLYQWKGNSHVDIARIILHNWRQYLILTLWISFDVLLFCPAACTSNWESDSPNSSVIQGPCLIHPRQPLWQPFCRPSASHWCIPEFGFCEAFSGELHWISCRKRHAN